MRLSKRIKFFLNLLITRFIIHASQELNNAAEDNVFPHLDLFCFNH
jgi:hypothetical protein